MVDTLLAMFSVGEALELIEANEVGKKARIHMPCAHLCSMGTPLYTRGHACTHLCLWVEFEYWRE
jgi:hypothetical protein